MGQFGISFKKARETLGISLDQIATETRIGIRFLHAIEDEDFHLLPGGIFNRGFIRTFAERVGLDPEQAVSDYERLSQVRDAEPVLRSMLVDPVPAKAPKYLYTLAIAGLAILVIGFYFLRAGLKTSGPSEPPPVAQTPPPTVPIVPPAQPSALPPPQETPTEEKPAVSTVAQPPSVTPTPTPQVASVTNRITAEMSVREATWIRLSMDGKPAMEDLLQPGSSKSYGAQDSMDLTIGNAGGVTLSLNGKEVRALGASGQVRTLKITAENVGSF